MNRTIPLVLAVALFMEHMDSTVLSTSLPAIAADIGTSPITLKLALTAYFVALAIFIPISGWMADRFGAKRVFCVAIGVFIAGSVACASSDSLGSFVVSRFLQGMGGAMMTPVGRLVLVRSTPRNHLVQAMAWLTVPALIGPLIGPPVGGFITTYFTWHWIFLINVPIGLTGIAVALRVLPDLPGEPAGRLDLAGFFLAGAAASGIVFGLSVVSLPALPPAVGLAALAAGVLSAIAYVRHARATTKPLIDLAILSNPAPRIAIGSGALFRIGVGAVPFLLPLMFQLAFGLNAFHSGLLTFSAAIGSLAMKFLAALLLKRFGFRSVLLASALLGSLLIGANACFTPTTPYWLIIVVLIAGGFTRSLFFTSNNTLVFAEIENREAGAATAMSAVAQQISIAMGVAFAGMILEAYHMVTGREIGLEAFSTAFIIVGAVAACSTLLIWRLSPAAGTNVSGHSGLGWRQGRTPPPSGG